jgi:hypothetical protein
MTSESQARSLLGVAPDADDAAIRRAYRRLARRCHPDTGGDPAEFHRLQQAVAVLLAPRPPAPKPAASPSTSRMTRPSTATRMGATGWGESAGPQWHEGEVDVEVVDWGQPLPDPPHAWRHDLVAIAVAAETDDGAPVPHLTGVSRRPGSRLNRLAVWLSSDLLARWEVRPARDRGIAGHDVELRIHLSAVRARRRADEAHWPLGWTRERRPSLTVVSQVLRPSPDRRATALRTADQLAAGLDALGWPLEDWHRPATP